MDNKEKHQALVRDYSQVCAEMGDLVGFIDRKNEETAILTERMQTLKNKQKNILIDIRKVEVELQKEQSAAIAAVPSLDPAESPAVEIAMPVAQ